MPVQIGWLDANGHPTLRIRVAGTHPTAVAETDAIIDTGFAGFLMLPIQQALPLGLALYGTGDYLLADGSMVINYLAEGTVTILPPPVDGESARPSDAVPESMTGTVVLCGESALVGMEFLRGLRRPLLLGSVVMLVDEDRQP